MNAKNYKEEWQAADNCTYLKASSFLAKQKLQHKIAANEDKLIEKTNLGKRTSSEVEAVSALADLSIPLLTIPSKKQAKTDMSAMLLSVMAIDMPDDAPIYADCDEIRRTLTKFFNTSGVTEGAWLRVVQCQSKSLNSFRGFRGPSAGAANNIYSKSWRFFEQKRIYEGRGKTPQQLEAENVLGPAGYSRKHIDPKKRGGWMFIPQILGDVDCRSPSENSSSPNPSPSPSLSTYYSTSMSGSEDGYSDPTSTSGPNSMVLS
jgi:hypothetical protein